MQIYVGVDPNDSDNRYCGKDIAAVLRKIEDDCGGQLCWQEWRDRGSFHVINWRDSADQELNIFVTVEDI